MAERRTERITRDYYAIGRPSIVWPRKRWNDDAETQNEADEDTDRLIPIKLEGVEEFYIDFMQLEASSKTLFISHRSL
jgi:hypothetical protein